MREIAKATGMSLGGLYHYFKSKEDLLFKILNHYMDLTLSYLKQDLSSLASPRAQIAFLLDRHASTLPIMMKPNVSSMSARI